MKDVVGRFVVVVNPASGGGEGGEAFFRAMKDEGNPLERLALARGAGAFSDWPLISTTKDGAWKRELEAELLAGQVRSVVAVGGDGTITEVASVLYGAQRSAGTAAGVVIPSLIPVPGGRGNDFVRGVCGFAAADDGDFWKWAAGRQWRSRPIDLATANDKLFINMASIGYGGEVVEKTGSRKAFWSKTRLVYQIEGALGLLEAPSCFCELKVDGAKKFDGAFFGGFVGNGRCNGGGLHWTPEAVIDDGKLDAIVFGKPGFATMLGALAAVKRKRAPSFKHDVARGATLSFRFDKPAALELDGEFVGRALTHEFKAVPHALRVETPHSAIDLPLTKISRAR